MSSAIGPLRARGVLAAVVVCLAALVSLAALVRVAAVVPAGAVDTFNLALGAGVPDCGRFLSGRGLGGDDRRAGAPLFADRLAGRRLFPVAGCVVRRAAEG
ncbi:MAG TPA: hypothetical protein DD491_14605, partial [Halieaceae bacterium]|nr:hypothetical protein [Halieaceae bacterium]